jgi:hypothetical protein
MCTRQENIQIALLTATQQDWNIIMHLMEKFRINLRAHKVSMDAETFQVNRKGVNSAICWFRSAYPEGNNVRTLA